MKLVPSEPLDLFANTHVGLVHETNEDSYALANLPDGGTMLLVCDGMGGMGRGDEASKIAIDQIEATMVASSGDVRSRIETSIREADDDIRRQLCGQGTGLPGSTAVLIVVRGGEAHVGWVGDSRGYWIHDGVVQARTRDHKLVEDLIDAGEMTPEEAKHSTLAHVVTRALGGRPPKDETVTPEMNREPWRLRRGDQIVICSDGLCDLAEDHEIAQAIQGKESEDAAAALQKIALDRGGHDNITIIVARWDGDDFDEDGSATPIMAAPRHQSPPPLPPRSADPSGPQSEQAGTEEPSLGPPPLKAPEPEPEDASGPNPFLVLGVVLFLILAAGAVGSVLLGG